MKKKYRSFEDAKNFVRKLGLKNTQEWREYCKSNKRPIDIPWNPERTYKKTKEWKNYGDWLGTGTIHTRERKYWSFDKARQFTHSLGIKNQRGWAAYCKSGKKPNNIPYHPERPYKNKGWKNYGDWLGTGMIRPRDRVYWTYDKSRDYVQKLGIKNNQAWRKFSKSGKLPKEIPADPYQVYKNKGWISFGHWFSTGYVASYLREYWSFEKARDHVHNLKLKSKREWSRYTNSGKLPKEIPTDVRGVYLKKGWKNYGDWLGTGTLQTQLREYWSYEKARDYVHKLKLKNQSEWRRYTKSGTLPQEIPSDPHKVYTNKGWKGYGDWLGTGRLAARLIEYLTFPEAKKFYQKIAQENRIKNEADWRNYLKTHELPSNIPRAPRHTYSKKNVMRRIRNEKEIS